MKEKDLTYTKKSLKKELFKIYKKTLPKEIKKSLKKEAKEKGLKFKDLLKEDFNNSRMSFKSKAFVSIRYNGKTLFNGKSTKKFVDKFKATSVKTLKDQIKLLIKYHREDIIEIELD